MSYWFSLVIAAVVPIIVVGFLLQLYFEVSKDFRFWFLSVIIILVLFILSYIAEGMGLIEPNILNPYIRRPLVSILIMILLPLLWAIKPCLVYHQDKGNNIDEPGIIAKFNRHYRRVSDSLDSLPEVETGKEKN